MNTTKENTSLIAKNTFILYGRMVFSMLVSLYTSRVVLNTLGVEDFGVYNVIGGVVAMFSFINGSMSGATSRFITYELGRGNYISLKETFSSALIVHLIIALFILVLSETVGLWFMENKLVIPEQRMFAARWVYQFSILASIIGIIQVPYNACVIAHEKMNVYAYVEMLSVSLKLIVVFLIQLASNDRLILYALLLVLVNIIILSLYIWYSYNSFEESHFEFVWRPNILKSMLTFSGADLYGNASVVLRQQGVNVVLNMFFGPIVNAANGIATTVNSVTMNLVANVSTAFRPQIIKKYASTELQEMFHLIKISAMISLLLFLTVAVPLILEMEFVMTIWLGQLPKYSADFCRILLIFSSCTVVTSVLNIGIHATGKIYLISFISGTIIWLAVPIIYCFLLQGYSPSIAYICNGIVSVLVLLTNSCILKYNIRQFSLKEFWINGMLKCLGICTITFCLTYFVFNSLSEGWVRLVSVCSVSGITNSLLAFIFILDNSMKRAILKKLHVSPRVSEIIIGFFTRVSGRIDWEKTKYKFWRLTNLRNQIKVQDSYATLEHIINSRCSVSRYGDGEFDMIIHLLTDGQVQSLSGFQSYDDKLAIRLKEIIEDTKYNDSSHIVCVPYWYRENNVNVYKPGVQRFCKRYICEKLDYILSIINKERGYYNANISRFYLSYKDKSHCQNYVNILKEIWKGRDICFVEGEFSRMGVGNDLFDNVKDIKRILCPSTDAFSKYEDILNAIRQNIDKSTLLILAIGHTATVLAYDLSKEGYQAIDLGHIDVEYEWMLQKASDKVPLQNKYVNEAVNGAVNDECQDIGYNNQIIARVI